MFICLKRNFGFPGAYSGGLFGGLIRGAYSGSPDFALNDISGAIFWSIERALHSKSLTFTMLSIFSYFVIGFASKKEYAIGAIFLHFTPKWIFTLKHYF